VAIAVTGKKRLIVSVIHCREVYTRRSSGEQTSPSLQLQQLRGNIIATV